MKVSKLDVEAAKAVDGDDMTVSCHVTAAIKQRVDIAVAHRQIPKGDWVIEAILNQLNREGHV
jgi:hypothetical protein